MKRDATRRNPSIPPRNLLTPRLCPGVLVYAADRLVRQLCSIFAPDLRPPNDFLQLAYSHLAIIGGGGVSMSDISTFARYNIGESSCGTCFEAEL